MRNAQTFQRMETPPLWIGDVLFADGNAAARTFGRAHRRRPYHFSYGSCHKIAGEGLSAALKTLKSRRDEQFLCLYFGLMRKKCIATMLLKA